MPFDFRRCTAACASCERREVVARRATESRRPSLILGGAPCAAGLRGSARAAVRVERGIHRRAAARVGVRVQAAPCRLTSAAAPPLVRAASGERSLLVVRPSRDDRVSSWAALRAPPGCAAPPVPLCALSAASTAAPLLELACASKPRHAVRLPPLHRRLCELRAARGRCSSCDRVATTESHLGRRSVRRRVARHRPCRCAR